MKSSLNGDRQIRSILMFIAKNQVRMHDTDMAGRLYFPRQFRFAHDALEDFLDHEGLNFQQLFHHEDFIIVIVHAEADYYQQVRVGDQLEIHVEVERIGNTSFVIKYQIFKLDKALVGSAKTIHVALDANTLTKVPLPSKMRTILERHLTQG